MLAAEADVMPPDDFLVAGNRHTGGDVLDSRGGEVADFFKEAGRVYAFKVRGSRLKCCVQCWASTRRPAKQILNAAHRATLCDGVADAHWRTIENH
jgi:hypothetical protein